MIYSIEGQRRSLKVEINGETGKFLFAGVSLPENTNSFFEPVIEVIQDYLAKPKEKTIVNFYIEYLNTSSALYLRRMIMLLEEKLGGDRLDVNWHFEKDDEDIKDFGEDFKAIFNDVKINLVEISQNPYAH